MKLTAEVTKVEVLRNVGGTDIISFYIDAPTPFPELGYEAVVEIKTRRGYAEEWLSKIGVTEFKLIDVKDGINSRHI